MDFDISDAKYKKSMTDFELSQETIYNTKSMTFQPLVKESKSMLLAVYPTEQKQYVYNTLEQTRVELNEYVRLELNAFKKNWNRFNQYRQNTVEVGRLGEFIGGLIKGISG